jgi:Ran GTPase-activating protein (RanGAP) involved in mRNA processing and transport
MNKIRNAGAAALAHALSRNPRSRMTSLNLSDNAIGPAGATALADAMRLNSTIMALDIGRNEIGAIGARSIASALRTNTTLTDLDLRFNTIENRGAENIASALRTNESLRTLRLTGNGIGPRGVKALAGALGEKNATLTELYLNVNEIEGEGASAFAAALAGNTTLTTLDLAENHLGRASVENVQPLMDEALAQAVENRRILAFLGAAVPGRPRARTPAEAFVLEDGDTALAHRIAKFLG